MTPNEIYTGPSIGSRGSSAISDVEQDIIPEVDWELVNDEALEQGDRIIVVDHACAWTRCDRSWEIKSVWFEGKPVMVWVVGGEGNEYEDRWVTDLPRYGAMVMFIKSYMREPVLTVASDPDQDYPMMTDFNGVDLNDHIGRRYIL